MTEEGYEGPPGEVIRGRERRKMGKHVFSGGCSSKKPWEKTEKVTILKQDVSQVAILINISSAQMSVLSPFHNK